jgi:hypothetical protein
MLILTCLLKKFKCEIIYIIKWINLNFDTKINIISFTWKGEYSCVTELPFNWN